MCTYVFNASRGGGILVTSSVKRRQCVCSHLHHVQGFVHGLLFPMKTCIKDLRKEGSSALYHSLSSLSPFLLSLPLVCLSSLPYFSTPLSSPLLFSPLSYPLLSHILSPLLSSSAFMCAAPTGLTRCD